MLGATCTTNDESCCVKLPPCKHNFGLYKNEEDCFCGLNNCYTQWAKYCTKSQHKCSTGPECTPPLVEKKISVEGKEFDVPGCEGSFSNVSPASLYARVGANELCSSYDAEGWTSIEDETVCQGVAQIFSYPFKVNMTRGYGCALDTDGSIYFGRGLQGSIQENYCMRK